MSNNFQVLVKKHYFVIFFLVISAFHSSSTLSQIPDSELIADLEANFVFVMHDYDREYVKEEILISNLGNAMNIHNQDLYQTYNYNFEFIYPNLTYTNDVNDYIDSISTSDWTSKLNTTALENQVDNFERTDIFDKQNGTAIDARLLEKYLDQNRPDSGLENDHINYIYLLNLTRLNIGGNEHWLNATEVDPDSGISRFYWRLEWDYPQNYDVKFPYSGWSETTEISILDLTAFNWYLEWWTIWGNFVGPPTFYDTLDDLIKVEDPDSIDELVTNELQIWIEPWLKNHFMYPTAAIELNQSVQSKTYVVYDDSLKNQSDIEWIVNTEFMNDEFAYITQSDSINNEVEYVALSQDPTLSNLIASSEVNYEQAFGIDAPFEDWTYYNGYNVWGQIANNPSLNNEYFSDLNSDVEVKGIILLLDNASYTTPGSSYTTGWTGNLFTGLGGSGVITMLWEFDRAFMPDGEKKSGLSKVLIHEIGHAIGFGHAWDYGYPADFSSEVMGYYPGSANFTQLFANSYWRNAVDANLIDKVIEKYTEIHLANPLNLELYYISDQFYLALDEHSAHDYLLAYDRLENLLSYIENLPLTTSESTTQDPIDSSTTSNLMTTSSNSISDSDTKPAVDSGVPYPSWQTIISISSIWLIVRLRKKFD